jgi:hypothetical protein
MLWRCSRTGERDACITMPLARRIGVRRAWAQGIHANPAAHEFGAEDSSEVDDCGLAGRALSVEFLRCGQPDP